MSEFNPLEVSKDRWNMLKEVDQHLKDAEVLARTATGRWDRGEEFADQAAQLAVMLTKLAEVKIQRFYAGEDY